MAMQLPDIIIQSIISDGVEDIKANPTFLDDVFGSLGSNYAQQRYGLAEIQKIKDLLTGANNTEIAITHSFHEAVSRTPAFAIQLASMEEDRSLARLGDFDESSCEPLDAAELALLVKATGIVPTGYDPVTGRVDVLDSVDLSSVYPRYIYEDGSGIEHVIQSGISDVLGSKFFFIPKQSIPDSFNPGLIKSFLTEKNLEKRGVTDDVNIIVGVFSMEALLTKYLFTLLQFILLSRKDDLIRRCFFVSSISGSDFTREHSYQGDAVFTRFLTITGKVEHQWSGDMFNLIDNVDIIGIPIE